VSVISKEIQPKAGQLHFGQPGGAESASIVDKDALTRAAHGLGVGNDELTTAQLPEAFASWVPSGRNETA
jgi:hypothetical protein